MGLQSGRNMAVQRKLRINPKTLIAYARRTGRPREYPEKSVIFLQGEPARTVFYIEKGIVKLTVVSKHGKEAIIAILSRGDFFGVECIAGQPLRMATAGAVTDCSVVRFEKRAMIRLLRGKRHEFSELFVAYLLSRNIRLEEDLVNWFFNSGEKRLARILLLLACLGKEGKPETVIPRISQETLAQMVGTTRSRVSHFMNRFRASGFIDYNGGLRVHGSLSNVVLHE